MFQDLRFAFRTLLKNPGFSLIAIGAIGLGIGANTAIFSVVNAALLRPLPVTAPDQLMYVFSGRQDRQVGTSSYPDFADLRNQNTVFSDMIAFGATTLRLTAGDQTEIIPSAVVSGNYFDTLGIQPSLGRNFRPEEDRTPMTHPVAILHHGFWTRRFGADPGIVGQNLTLNGRGFTIVGIAPPGFTSIDLRNDFQIYVPLMMQELVRPPSGGFAGGDANLLDKRGQRWLTMVGRLKPNTAQDTAQANVKALAAQMAEAYPNSNTGVLAMLQPAGKGRPDVRQQLVPVASMLMAVVAAVLLIACANVANLMLARFSARRREIAVRLSMGASRVRLLRQLLTEGILMSFAGGVLGLVIATWIIRVLVSGPVLQSLLPVRLDVSPDIRVLSFTFLLSVATGIVFGLAPALRSLKFDVVGDLKNETASIQHGRLFGLRNLVVVGQMAISIVLLIGAGLFLRSFWAAQSVDLGVDTEKLITMPMSVNLLRYSRPQSTAFYRQAIERVEALPGVESASIARVLMLSGGGRTYTYYPDGVEPGPDTGVPVSANVVGLNFFRTLGIPLLRGRDFSEQDREGTPLVTVVNEALARSAWPGQEAVGQLIRFGANQPPAEVIGVVRDAKYISIQEPSRPFLYLSVWQNFETGMTLHVRVRSNPASMLSAIRTTVQSIDKNLPLPDIRTMADNANAALMTARVSVVLIGVFAALALVLAGIGAYGVMSYSVAQRSREIGVRMALGAQPADVLRLVVRQGMTLALAGILIGVVAAFVLTRFVGSMLFAVSPTDPVTFIAVGAVLAAVALFANYIPARRASRVDPMIAVRQE